MALGAATTAAHELPVAKSLPSSVKLIQTGDAELQAELSGAFIMAIVVGILCVYCVLVLLFKDFIQPITILSAIPLSIGGAFFGLLVRSEEHTSELQSLMRISYAVFCLKKKKTKTTPFLSISPDLTS